jgi:hypothetical protein
VRRFVEGEKPSTLSSFRLLSDQTHLDDAYRHADGCVLKLIQLGRHDANELEMQRRENTIFCVHRMLYQLKDELLVFFYFW